MPASQTALPFEGAGHTFAQPPQLVAFDCVSTHASPHRVVFAGQLATHAPSTHTIPVSQMVSQLPQCVGSLAVFTHESPQRAYPLAQTKPHIPSVQVAIPFAGASHALSQAPQ